MVVVVDVPGADGGGEFGFAVPGVGVEELFGQDALVALDFAVVPRCVGAGALVPGGVGECRASDFVAGELVDPLSMEARRDHDG